MSAFPNNVFLSDRIQEIVLLNRTLDCTDEDATLEEQGEKIMYFYSTTSTELVDQLSTCTLIESLIELANKFSHEAIQSAVMQKKIWTFVQVETDVWFVVSVLHDASLQALKVTSNQTVTTKGMEFCLQHCYSLFFCLNGTIHQQIFGHSAQELSTRKAHIESIQKTTKVIRKLKKKIIIGLRDIDNFMDFLKHRNEDGSDDTDHTNLTTIDGQKVDDIKSNLKLYQLEVEDKEQQLQGLTNNRDFQIPVVRKKLAAFLEWYFTLEEVNDISCFHAIRNLTTVEQCIRPSCMLSYAGRTLWNDLDRFSSRYVHDFLTRWDATIYFSEPSVNRLLRSAVEDYAKFLYDSNSSNVNNANMKCEYDSMDPVQRDRLAKILKSRDDRLTSRVGVAASHGTYCSIDTFPMYLQYHFEESNSTAAVGNDSSKSSLSAASTSQKIQSTPNSPATDATGNYIPAGKLGQSFDSLPLDHRVQMLFPRLHTKSMDSGDENETVLLGRLLLMFFGKMVVAVVLSETAMQQLHIPAINHLIETRGKELLCRQVKTNWLVDHIDRINMKEDYKSSADIAANPALSYPGYQDDLFRIQSLYAIHKVFRVAKAEFDAPSSSSTPSMPSPNAAGLQSSSSAACTLPSPAMLRACITTKPFADRDIRAFCITPTATFIKFLSGEVNTPTSLMNFSTPNPTLATANAESLDQFFLNMNQYGDTSHAFYNAFAAAFGMTALRALHEIWAELTDFHTTMNPENLYDKMSTENVGVDMLCTRISTSPRGGVWVFGKRILGGQVFLCALNQCNTVNEVIEVVDLLIMEAQAVIV